MLTTNSLIRYGLYLSTFFQTRNVLNHIVLIILFNTITYRRKLIYIYIVFKRFYFDEKVYITIAINYETSVVLVGFFTILKKKTIIFSFMRQ